MSLCEYKASFVSIVDSGTDRAKYGDPVSKKEKKHRTNKQTNKDTNNERDHQLHTHTKLISPQESE